MIDNGWNILIWAPLFDVPEFESTSVIVMKHRRGSKRQSNVLRDSVNKTREYIMYTMKIQVVMFFMTLLEGGKNWSDRQCNLY